MTYGEVYGPAMKITDQAEAAIYFETIVALSMRESGHSREVAEQIERSNLGYYAGYYGHETRERVERLFQCEHPVLGSIAKNGPPMSEEAFQKGYKLGCKGTTE